MTTLEDLTDNGLTVTIERYRSVLARLEAEVARRQCEREARALEDYWRAHPEMTPVKVGDNVMINDHTINILMRQKIHKIGDVIKVVEIRWYDNHEPQFDLDGVICWVLDSKSISEMRKAYLQSAAANESEATDDR